MVLQKQYNSIYSKYFGSKVKRTRAGSATRELHASPCVHAQSLSHIVLFAIPRTVVHQASLSMGFPRYEILEWVAISSSRGSFQRRDRSCISCTSCIAGRLYTTALSHQQSPAAWAWKTIYSLQVSLSLLMKLKCHIMWLWKSDDLVHIKCLAKNLACMWGSYTMLRVLLKDERDCLCLQGASVKQD